MQMYALLLVFGCAT